MSLLDKILAWSESELSLWQRDALRRLLQKRVLSTQDLEDLYAMLREDYGLADTHGRKPVPLAKTHLPSPAASAAPILLLSMRDLKNVNRLAGAQKLDFARTGISVIYGGNAAGKSGYSRVLKKACRARDAHENVHPDASDLRATGNVPEATFDVEINGTHQMVTWKRDAAPPDQLATVAVLDTKCARAYLTEGDVAYLPYGLDIVESLGQIVLPDLAQRIALEVGQLNTDVAPFADLLGDTEVGRLLKTIDANADPAKVTALATLSEDSTKRLTELEKTLAESDPIAKAKLVQLQGKRLVDLRSRIDTAAALVDDKVASILQSSDNEAELANKAEVLAAKTFLSDATLLSGTGEAVWKSLFDAARRFSLECAYMGKPFPFLGAGAQCPLCQQTLDAQAVVRLQRFDEFILQDAAKAAVERRKIRDKAATDLSRASVEFRIDTALAEELDLIRPGLLDMINSFEKSESPRVSRRVPCVSHATMA